MKKQLAVTRTITAALAMIIEPAGTAKMNTIGIVRACFDPVAAGRCFK